MLDRGVALPAALAALQPALRRGEPAQALTGLIAAVDRGATLSRGLADVGADPLEVAMVEAAETTGHLGPALRSLAEGLRREQEILGKLRGALMQPVLLAASAAVLLPAPTAVQNGIPSYLATAGLGLFLVAVVAVALLVGVPTILRHPRARGPVLRIFGAIPGFAQLVRLRRMSLLFGTLGPALEAGLPLDRALALAGDATLEAETIAACDRIRAEVRTRGGLAGAAATLPGIDQESLARLAGGEASGALAEVAQERAATFATRHHAAMQRTATVVRMVGAGIVTLAVAAAITMQLGKVVSDPMSMLPESERHELERELERALPSRRR